MGIISALSQAPLRDGVKLWNIYNWRLDFHGNKKIKAIAELIKKPKEKIQEKSQRGIIY